MSLLASQKNMKIIPALDFLNGQIVRLHQGQYDQVTDFSVNLKDLCAALKARKITEVHCVNLTGAKDPEASIESFAKSVHFLLDQGLQIQVGGGIRTVPSLQKMRQLGVHRIVVGTWAWENPNEFVPILRELPKGTITLGFDVRFNEATQNINVATQGWMKQLDSTQMDWQKQLNMYLQNGVERVLCTEVSRDGTMAGPHIELYQYLLKKFSDLKLQASGGVRGAEDLENLKKMGADSVLIGKSWLLHWQTHKTLPEWIKC